VYNAPAALNGEVFDVESGQRHVGRRRRPAHPARFCSEGQNACPPEDVGGPPGYARFLEAVSDPEDEEHERHLTWVGGSFDPSEFDLALANARLQKVR
jgi:hypothetical protein